MSTVGEVRFNYTDAPAAPAAPPEPQPNQPLMRDAPATSTEASDLEELIQLSEQKLASLRAQSSILDTAKAATREIDSVRAAIVSADDTIAKFEGKSAAALERIDAAVAQQYGGTLPTGAFGVPLANAQAESQAAGKDYVALRQSLFQQKRSRANLVTRLEDLERVQGSK